MGNDAANMWHFLCGISGKGKVSFKALSSAKLLMFFSRIVYGPGPD